MAEGYCVDELDRNTFRLAYRTIHQCELKEKNMIEKLKRINYHTNFFCGSGNKCMLISKNDKIDALIIIRKYIVNWYHTYLLHLGEDRVEATISHHLYFQNAVVFR